MPLMLALNPVLSNLLMLVFIAVAVIMILIILIQRPSGGGLSGAFGASSGGSGQTAFGAKTGDALTMMTIGTFVVFILTAIMLVFTSRPPATVPGQPTAAPVGEQVPAETTEGDPTTTTPTTTPGEGETADPASPDPDAPGDTTPPRPTPQRVSRAIHPPTTRSRARDSKPRAGAAMIRSMTGFGDARVERGGVTYSLEVRSVNHRYLKAQGAPARRIRAARGRARRNPA